MAPSDVFDSRKGKCGSLSHWDLQSAEGTLKKLKCFWQWLLARPVCNFAWKWKSKEKNPKILEQLFLSGNVRKYWLVALATASWKCLILTWPRRNVLPLAVNTYPWSSSSHPAQFISSVERLGDVPRHCPRNEPSASNESVGVITGCRESCCHTPPLSQAAIVLSVESGCLWVGRLMRLWQRASECECVRARGGGQTNVLESYRTFLIRLGCCPDSEGSYQLLYPNTHWLHISYKWGQDLRIGYC